MIESILEMWNQRKNETTIARSLGLKVSYVHERLEREYWNEIDQRHFAAEEIDLQTQVVEEFGEGPWRF